ncbi:MAG: ABC transporter ATP-binding protein [Ignisphaera sp.]|nr:ABC transporter ATP-binding protein [Ignisphaera sp.]MDW8084816.1 ABC transporter ATP-binding protein [Ignisphaera sp.]
MSGTAILAVNDLHIDYYTFEGVVRAVRGVSIELCRGESLCIVGESGSGKSTIGLAIVRALPPNGIVARGEILYNNVDILRLSEEEMSKRIRGKEISIVFQDPAATFNPLFTIGEVMLDVIAAQLGVRDRRRAYEHGIKMLKLVELPDPERVMNSYPHELSGGMLQRAAIAVALSANPKLLIADEPTTMLDVTIQAQVLDLLKRLRKELSLSMIFITHNLGVAAEVCDRIMVLYAGTMFEEGYADTILTNPIHPYTRKLLECIPRASRRVSRLRYIPGSLPDLKTPVSGCPFEPRCDYATKICSVSPPLVRVVGHRHRVACHLAQEKGGV